MGTRFAKFPRRRLQTTPRPGWSFLRVAYCAAALLSVAASSEHCLKRAADSENPAGRVLELTVCKIGPKRSRLGQFAPKIIRGLRLVSLIKDPHHVRLSLSPLSHRDPEQESCSIHYGIQDTIIRDALRSFVPPSNPES